MKPQKFNDQFATIYQVAVRLCKAVDADALLVLVDGPTDWDQLSSRAGREKLLVAADTDEQLKGERVKRRLFFSV